ncbi:MAG: hypothetical protein QG667_2082, partial [Pseudomonadota bacterium]|nr:hypothetical protein [Pseudomonadota bacterium]
KEGDPEVTPFALLLRVAYGTPFAKRQSR